MSTILKKILASISVGCMAFLLVACGGSKSDEGQLDVIKKRDSLIIGVKKDTPNFALMNLETNVIEGFEADIAKMLAKEILGDETKVELAPVTAKTRGPLLDNGTLDAVIATFTITDERKDTYDFSEPYYSDPIGLLVLKENNFTNLKDLDGKKIGVSQSSTTGLILTQAAQDAGIKIDIEEFPDYPSLKIALDAKRIDAFSVDKSILKGYVDDNTVILDDDFQPQEYGIATRKADPAWSEFVNNFVKDHKSDIDAAAKKWNLGK